MTELRKTLEIRHAPHITGGASVDTIMFNVVLALAPAVVFAVWVCGLAGLLTLATAVASCAATEHLLCRRAGRPSTLGDWSVVVTGLLLALTLPPSLPLWMTAVGGVIAVGLGKHVFGGLGNNPFNPALVGRAVLQAAFPAAMTSWPATPSARFTSLPASTLTAPLAEPRYDALSQPTPLADWKFGGEAADTADLFLGTVGGSTGETSALLLLLGGAYLIGRGMMSWQIPLAVLLTVGICSGVLHLADPSRHASAWFMLCSGGLMLGAVFMATDPVASPMTTTGCVLYGIVIGLLVVVIRVWGAMPEGVMYAILLANAVSPHIDHWVQPRAYGHKAGGA